MGTVKTVLEVAELAEAFEREARILNSLHHPVLPHVSDYFSGPDGHFLVMEYIEGEDLSEMVKRDGAFPVDDVVRWAMELLDTLDYLHSQDPPIIHRDIKPGNLKLTSRGNIVLLDFGLAKETTGNTQGARSIFGYSRRYSPLEQIEGAGTDVRSDIFSLGATLFHLMTGEPPVDALARASAIVAGRRDPLVPADEVNPNVPPAVSKVLSQALALDPGKRFALASVMRSALEAAVEGKADSVLDNIFEPAVIDFASDNETEVDDLPLTDEIIDLDDTEAVPAIPPLHVEGRPSRPRAMRDNIPLVQRPALWVAVLALALMAIGFAGSRMSSSNKSGNAVVEQQTSQGAPGVTPDESQANPAGTPTASEPDSGDAVSDTDENTQIQPEVALEKKTAERPEKKDVSRSDDEATVDGKIATKRQPHHRQPQAREVAVDRQTVLIRPLPERPRIVRRREPVYYGPPASSIETIFTGVPPEFRRRWRRIYP